jgi:Uma2 family endonuclease
MSRRMPYREKVMTAVLKQEKKLYTLEDLDLLPADYRCELIRGELRKMPPPPGEEHGDVNFVFTLAAGNFIVQHDLGRGYTSETGFLIGRNPDTLKAPDFAFVAKERLPATVSTKPLPLAPDLVLETRSPSDRPGMVREKVQEWLDAGTRMVLELNLKTRLLTVYKPGKEPQELGINDTFEGGDVLPGFTLPIRRLFRDAR